jgi:hypothetical protein
LAQRCLDLIAFERKLNMLIQKPSDKHIVLFRRENKLVLHHVAVSNLGGKLECASRGEG